jgi:AraC family transcriptional regulator of adaptative response/methylated-DNA-[protein]-cysteine methyltransferase
LGTGHPVSKGSLSRMTWGSTRGMILGCAVSRIHERPLQRSHQNTMKSHPALPYYMVHQTELGTSLLVVENSALIAHYLGENETSLLGSLNSCLHLLNALPLPNGSHSKYSKWLDCVVSNSPSDVAVPLTIRGTVFQQRVWRYLITIPRGAMRSYSEVAQAIGYPSAVRAVASACAQNQIALAIPCHRVIRADGSFGGYRWGIERKRLILERETSA